MSLLCYWLQYLPNGGIQWLLVKPWTSSIGQYARYCTGAEQLRKLGKLLSYYLDKFNLKGVYQCTAAAIKMASKAGPFF
jgi:hypothetical protein